MKHILILFAVLSSLGLQAQRFSANLNFQLPVPQGAFQETFTNAVAPGARFNVYFRPSVDLPFDFGLDFGWASLRSEQKEFTAIVLGFEKDYRLNASSSFFSIGALLRVQPVGEHQVTPYAEGMLGWNIFTDQITLTELDFNGDDVDSSTGESDGAFYIGAGAGLRIKFKKEHRAGLNLSCAYLRGNRAEYADSPQISNSGVVSFEYKRSTTNMILPQIGFWGYLDGGNNKNNN